MAKTPDRPALAGRAAALLSRLRSLPARSGFRQGAIMFAATSLANVLDYGYSLAMGRMLTTDGFGILVAIQAALQIVAVSLAVIRTTVARSIVAAEAQGQNRRTGRLTRWALQRTAAFGFAAALLVGALSGPISRALRIPSAVPVLVMAGALLPLLVKPVIEGSLQGLQHFGGLGTVHVTHAALRLAAGVLLVALGLDAVGALAALPIATVTTVLLGVALLWAVIQPDPQGPQADTSSDLSGSLARYVGKTSIGLVSFAVLVNMDALVVKHYAAPLVAGHYSMAVTLGKIILFLPIAFVQVLFPKSAERHVQSRDSSRLLRLAQVMTLVPCAILTAAYLGVPDLILHLVFGVQNPFDGPVLGLLALAVSSYALANVWLYYFLSVDQAGFVYLLPAAAAVQLGLLAWWHASLLQVVTVLAGTGAALLVAGEVWFQLARARARPSLE